MTVRFGMALAIFLAWAIPVQSQGDPDLSPADSAAADSLQARMNSLAQFVQGPTLDSLRTTLGDSIFLPPAGKARIFRDRYGVPHIYGETDTDVAFGFGYAQAEDHLVEMLLNYRQARGRAAEILGREYLPSDHMSLLWRIESIAGERYGTIPEEVRSVIGGFVAGVNHYIEIHRHLLPNWVEPITGTDVVALSRWGMFLLSELTGASELAQQGMRPSLQMGASSQWVVAPFRSESGATLFVMDPHLPWTRQQQLYEAHLVSEEGLNVSGATAFGWPVILMGHNDRLAWMLTTSQADAFDLYEVKLDRNNPRRYLYEDETRRMTSRSVRIPVRQGTDVVQVSRELTYTHHGPVYRSRDGWAYAARFSIQDEVNAIGQLYEMNRASSLGGFISALRQLQLPMFHITYGDADGNLYYVFNARCPVRSEAFDWRKAVPGWSLEAEWQGILEFDQLPQVTNPPAGFLQNCNDAPNLVTRESGLSLAGFPSFLGWGQPTIRGNRVFNRLVSVDKVSLSDMKELVRDTYLLDAEELKGHILRAYNASWPEIYDPESRLARAIDLLRSWDNRASVESRATLLFAIWKERFDPLLARISEGQRNDVRVLEELALESLRSAVAYTEATYGRLDVRWGDVHVISRGDTTFAIGGSPNTAEAIHRLWADVGEDGIRRVKAGSAFTMVAALADTAVEAWSLVPYGASEDPDSPHFDDQAALHESDTLKPAWFTQEEINSNLESITTVPFEMEQIDIERERAFWKSRLRELAEEAKVVEDAEAAAGEADVEASQ